MAVPVIIPAERRNNGGIRMKNRTFFVWAIVAAMFLLPGTARRLINSRMSI